MWRYSLKSLQPVPCPSAEYGTQNVGCRVSSDCQRLPHIGHPPTHVFHVLRFTFHASHITHPSSLVLLTKEDHVFHFAQRPHPLKSPCANPQTASRRPNDRRLR